MSKLHYQLDVKKPWRDTYSNTWCIRVHSCDYITLRLGAESADWKFSYGFFFRAVVNFKNILLSFLFQVVAHPMHIPCCRLLNLKEFDTINTVL